MSGYCQEGEPLPHPQLAGKSYHHYPNLLVSQSITYLPFLKNQNSGVVGYDGSKSMPNIGHSKDSRIGKCCVSGGPATYVLGAMIFDALATDGSGCKVHCLITDALAVVALGTWQLGCDRGRGSCCSISSPQLAFFQPHTQPRAQHFITQRMWRGRHVHCVVCVKQTVRTLLVVQVAEDGRQPQLGMS